MATFLHGNLGSALAKSRRADEGAAEEPVFPRIARRHPAEGRTGPKDAAEAYASAVALDPQIRHAAGRLRPGADRDRRAGVVEEGGDDTQHGLDRDKENISGYRYLAQAYGSSAKSPQAELATAEGHFYAGDYKEAKIFAMRAQHEDQARIAGLGSRAGHHQLQVPRRRNEPFASRTGECRDRGRSQDVPRLRSSRLQAR